MRKQLDYDYVTEHATDTKGMNLHQIAKFHYFNPNGLVAAKRAQDEAISDLVDAGMASSGWHMAYGTFADYEVKQIIKLAMRNKAPSRVELTVAVNMLQDHVESVKAKIAAAKDEATIDA